MRTSKRGIDFIKGWEALSLKAYAATEHERKQGIYTIGYGNTRWHDGTPVKEGDTLPNEWFAEELLTIDLMEREKALNEVIKVTVTQGQFDALVSLAYNIGVSAFKKSTLLRKLNSGDYKGAANEFPKWDKQAGRVLNGLVRRRKGEQDMFNGLVT